MHIATEEFLQALAQAEYCSGNCGGGGNCC